MEINNTENTQELELIYLTIPQEYSIIYNRILQCLLDAGIELIKNCSCECKNNKIKILYDCWFAFQSAIAAKKLQREKEASLIIKYISAQLDLLCGCDSGIEEPCSCKIVEVDFETGILKVESECETCNIPIFYINPNNGNLYSEYEANSGSKVPQNIKIIDSNLIQIK